MADFRSAIIVDDKFSSTFQRFDASIGKSTAELGKLDNALDKTGKQANSALGGDGGGLAGGLVAGLSVAALGAAAYKVGDIALELGNLGAQSITTRDSFNALMLNIGQSPSLLDNLKRAAGGTVSEMQLMQQANTALAGTSGQLAQEMSAALPRLLEAGRAAAKLNPSMGDANFMFQSLITGIKRGSPMLIDNTGLTLKMGEANEAYAASIGKTVEELTSQERSIAILRATLEGTDTLIAQVGGSLDSMADSSTRAKRAWEDFKTAIGESLAPTTSAIQNDIATALDRWTSTISGNEMTQATQQLEQYQALVEKIENTPVGFRPFRENFLTDDAKASALADAQQQVEKYRQELGALIQQENAGSFATQAAAHAAREAASAYDDSGTSAGRASVNLAALVNMVQGIHNAYSAATGVVAALNAELKLGKTYIGGVDVLSSTQYVTMTRQRAQYEKALNVEVAMGTKTQIEADYALARYDRNVNNHIQTLRAATRETTTHTSAVKEIDTAYDDLRNRVSGALRPTFDLSGLTGGALGGGMGDAFDEAYKRLAAVALRPEELQIHAGDWADTFAQAGLTDLTPEEAQQRARELVEAYSKGLDFSLIDREAIKDQVRHALKAEEIYNTIVDEITAEMQRDNQNVVNSGSRLGNQVNRGMIAAARSGARDVAYAYLDVMEPELIKRLDARARRQGVEQ